MGAGGEGGWGGGPQAVVGEGEEEGEEKEVDGGGGGQAGDLLGWVGVVRLGSGSVHAGLEVFDVVLEPVGHVVPAEEDS